MTHHDTHTLPLRRFNHIASLFFREIFTNDGAVFLLLLSLSLFTFVRFLCFFFSFFGGFCRL